MEITVNTMEPILQIRNLNKFYPNGVHALKGVSFDVYPGEFLVIIGLSGSGKSTLLRCINRLHSPSSGTILWQGRDIAKIDNDKEIRNLRRRIAMIFQQFNLVLRYSVLTNVLLGRLGYMGTLRSVLGLFSEKDREMAYRFLDLVGIKDKAKIRSEQLSGGQQQRVAIARALTQDPEILLADEPVASLDPATCHHVMDYLLKVNRELGITIIANLHFLSLVRKYATRVIALKAGEVVFSGSPNEIDSDWFSRIYGKGSEEVHIT